MQKIRGIIFDLDGTLANTLPLCIQAFRQSVEPLDQVRAKGIRLAMVTGKGKHSTDISLKKFGLTSCFEIIETGSAAGPRKADGIRQVLAGLRRLAAAPDMIQCNTSRAPARYTSGAFQLMAISFDAYALSSSR